MNNSITNFLEIQGYKILESRENFSQELIVRIGKKSLKNTCPKCQSSKVSVHACGKWKLKKHSNFQEKLIYFEVARNRIKCLKCGEVFSEELQGIPKYSRKTNNFEKQSLNYLSKNSFNEVGRVNKVSYGTLKDQLYRYVDPYKLLGDKIKKLNSLKNIYLGLDGQSFRKLEMVLTITEVNIKEPITILPTERQSDLLRFIERLSPEIRQKVAGIAVDMTNKHLKLLREYFPNALIVIDHYHVIQNAIQHLQRLRTTIQSARKVSIPIKKELEKNHEDLTCGEKNKLLKYFIKFPELKEAYKIKEEVRSLYRISTFEKAEQKLCTIKSRLLNSRKMELIEMGKTLSNWQTEILNYFKCRITNAYTEGLHTKCKLIKRKSFGFRNVQTYVRKLLLGLIPLITILSLHTF